MIERIYRRTPHRAPKNNAIFLIDGNVVLREDISDRCADGGFNQALNSVFGNQGNGFVNRYLPVGEGLADGPLADRVKQVIEMQVNPAIASHGGSVTLVEIRDDIVYLEMMGGCQGCGMAAVTLAQGIRRIIMENVPDVRDIVDVTNHDAGVNPYY